jgi:histidyl-tRNA synthetase
MAQKPSIPKGTRDFNPEELIKRHFIFDKIKAVFKLYGFQGIETPSFENSSTLMGKYGEEGDRLIFKILNSGDYLSKANSEALETKKQPIFDQFYFRKGIALRFNGPFCEICCATSK